MMRDPAFWLTNMGVLAPPFISTAIFFHQDFILAERGWSYELFALSFIILTFASIFSGLVSGIFIDHKSATALLPTSLLPLAVGCLVLAIGQSHVAMISYMVLVGISAGLTGSVLGTIWPEVYGVEHLGAIRSVVTAQSVLFSALGPGAMGWAIDFGMSMEAQFLGLGLYCLLGVAAMLISSKIFQKRLQTA